jgi:hypothetical protein
VLAPLILSACGGFLLAVLWMDLLFDIQVMRHRTGDVPDDVLASIAAYYRRVTTTSRPMGRLVVAVMVVALATLGVELATVGPRWHVLASCGLGGAPIIGAIVKTFGDAARLGARRDDIATQSALARSIFREHVWYVVGITSLIALQIVRGVAQ